jgi:hypothetical protein
MGQSNLGNFRQYPGPFVVFSEWILGRDYALDLPSQDTRRDTTRYPEVPATLFKIFGGDAAEISFDIYAGGPEFDASVLDGRCMRSHSSGCSRS